jgi:hypothetical protein
VAEERPTPHFAVDAREEEDALTDGRGKKWRELDDTLADLLPQLFRIEEQQKKMRVTS